MKYSGVALIVLFIVAGIFIGTNKDRMEQKEIKENIDYFNNNSSEILNQIKTAFDNANYKEVTSLSAKYLPSKNKELIDLHNEAQSKLKAIEKSEEEARKNAERERKTKEILAKLKNIPASHINRNKILYQELVSYNPDVKKYKDKLDYYSGKVKEQDEKKRIEKEKIIDKYLARIDEFGAVPVKNSLNGSYYPAVESYLRVVAHDSDSIEFDGCTKVYPIEEGWLVGCDYRGRNAFGAKVRQSNWFTIVHGTVIMKHEASAYNP